MREMIIKMARPDLKKTILPLLSKMYWNEEHKAAKKWAEMTSFLLLCGFKCTGVFIVCKSVLPQLSFAAAADAIPVTENEEIVTGFRPGHNLSLFVSASQFRWKVGKAAELKNAQLVQTLPSLTLRYAYHSNLYKNTGLVFATGTSVHVGNKTEEGFRSGVGIQLPSLSVGLSQNFSTLWRATTLVEYAATWFPWMTATGVNSRVQLASLPDTIMISGQLDHFVSLNSAISFEGGFGLIGSSIVAKPSTNTVASNSDFRAQRFWVGMGWTIVLGDVH
jgi:hypothetical protein